MKLIKNNETVALERIGDGFNYVLEGVLEAGATVFIKMPPVSANKRGVNDIGWQCDGFDVELYATLSTHPEETVLWSEVEDNYVVNKTVSALKVTNNDSAACNICIRVILN